MFDSVSDFVSSVFSFRGIQSILFLVMIFGLFVGNNLCKGVNETVKQKFARLQLEHDSEYIDLLERGVISEIPKMPDHADKLTWTETVCKEQQAFLGQLAIAILVVTALRYIVPKARQAGERKAKAQIATSNAEKKNQ